MKNTSPHFLEQAQVHDSANTASRGPRNHRQVNTNQLVFEGTDYEDAPQERETFSHNIGYDHVTECDQDTDIDVILCNSMDTGRTGRRHARVNLSTWKSLTPEDQTAWDAVADDGKTKILNCASIRGNRKDKNDSHSRSADSHDLQDNGPNLEVGTHVIEDTPDILAMAARTHKTNRVQSEAHIRKLLAKTHHQHTKSASFERSPFTPEACAHERISNQELDSTLLSDEDEREHEQRVTPNPSANVNSDAEQTSVKSDAERQLIPLNPSAASSKNQDVSSDAHIQDLSTCFQQGITLKRDETGRTH